MWREQRSMILPVVLVLLGVILLHGCIYIPTFNKHHSGVDASRKVGDSDSRKPLRVGTATRADVERVLGRSKYVNADGSEVMYTWVVQSGVWMSICFGSDEVTSMRGLRLTFDGDVLRGVHLEKNPSRLRQWIRDNSTATPPWLESPAQSQPSPTAPPASHAPGTAPPPPPGPTYETQPKNSP